MKCSCDLKQHVNSFTPQVFLCVDHVEDSLSRCHTGSECKRVNKTGYVPPLIELTTYNSIMPRFYHLTIQKLKDLLKATNQMS